MKFLRFFKMPSKSFVSFIFITDIVMTICLIYPLYIIPEYYEDNSLFIPLLFHFNYFFTIVTIVSFIYYLISTQLNWFVHRFYLWSRFLYYFGFASSFLILFSSSLFYEVNKKDKKHIHIAIMVSSVLLCSFYVINIMWCLAMKKILDN